MRVLILGNGAREHALAAAVARSPRLTQLWVAPGNPGTAALATNVPIGVTDIAALVAFARETRIDLVIPGPEDPLVAGIADALAAANIPCCGPTLEAARLEGSKTFTKQLADAAGIPTARWERFEDPALAHDFVRRRGAPIVVKADGLAAGKGVVVAQTVAQAEAAITALMQHGTPVVIEECLHGEEVSLFALCDGTTARLLGAAQDHKRVGDGDTGPNTGGMGAVSPPMNFGPAQQQAALDAIIRPALAAMAARGTPFRGILFAGLMLTSSGPALIEFNVRLGDPECQALLPRLRSDLLTALHAATDGTLADTALDWSADACVAVVLAARGYPGEPARGGAITGLDRAASLPEVQLFHGATERRGDALVAAGGRVLTIAATGPDIGTARDAAYAAVAAITWPDGFCRTDIGLRAMQSVVAR